MNKRWCLKQLPAAALAILLAIPALADDYWDPSKRVEPTPASSAEGRLESLNAVARGICSADKGTVIDAWFLTCSLSETCLIRCTPPQGMMIMIK